jgi:hypothetical protein
VVPAYLYLLGPESRGVTGQALSAQPPERVPDATAGVAGASRN